MEFVLERYNYWIIILLMMGGLYIVFESENLIKKLVGLGIFQTSVIIFYVTLGKTAGGTAPILIGGGHGEDHGEEHAAAGHEAAAHGAAAAHAGDPHAEPPSHAENGTAALDAHDAPADSALDAPVDAAPHASVGEAPHAVATPQFTSTPHAPSEAVADAVYGQGGEPLHMAAGDIIYSNPLPHVLMLTAIVVGVATLSVGLALVVRIREAYGTIEMDDVRDADIAEGEAEGETA